MRGVVVWLSGVTLAFLLTAGAFLLLANIATIPEERTLSPKSPAAAASQPLVGIELDPDQLASLRSSQDQSLDLTLRNEGDSPLTHVNVTLMVSSENTALSASRYYQHTVAKVPARGATDLRFGFDLSEPEQHVKERPAPEPAREILEFKATTPGGISTTRTVILPP